MKKFSLLLLLLCGFAAAFVSCKDDGNEELDFRFSRPEVTGVTQTAADVSCQAAFDPNEYAGLTKGFAYGLAGDDPESYTVLTNPTVNANTLSVRLTGLSMQTRYRVYAFVQLASARFMSAPAEFETLAADGDAPVVEITSPTTLQAPAEGAEYTITFTVLNPVKGSSADFQADQMWVQWLLINAEDGMTSFAVEPNTGAARTAVITVSYPGAQSRTVTVNQASGSGETPAEPSFGTPSHASVTSSGATVSCAFSYEGAETVSKAWFAYETAGGVAQQVQVAVSAGNKSATLSGLSASTTYTYRLCVEVGGKTYQSASAAFTTLSDGGETDKARYTGWAELPVEVEKTGDYYYAYHMRADNKSVRNYSVCYSADMRCAVWTAAPMHTCYDGSAGRNDSWQYDPEIPRDVQPNLKNSYAGVYSRGHMVASSDRQVSVGTNQQTFYFTNMAPQYQNHFNGGIWEKLEKWCLTQRCSDTLYVVTGAHFANRNKTCSDKDGKKVVVPTHFYKILMRSKSGNTGKPLWKLTSDQIECVGFWFEHNESYATTEKPSAKYMKSVSDIEKLTGFTFYSNVPDAPKDTYKASDWGM